MHGLLEIDPSNTSHHFSRLEKFERASQSQILTIQMKLDDYLSVPPSPFMSLTCASKGIEMEKSKESMYLTNELNMAGKRFLVFIGVIQAR